MIESPRLDANEPGNAWSALGSMLVAVAVLLALLMAPPSASATTGFLAGSGQVAVVNLNGTGGYRVGLSGAVEGTHSTVTLAVSLGSSSADYEAPGTVSPTAIHASFGDFGKVALHFRSFKLQRVGLPEKCRSGGSPAVTEARVGLLVGTVRFRGEGGYTQLNADRVKGGIGEVPAVFAGLSRGGHISYICATSTGKSPQAGHPQRSQSAVLQASTGGGTIGFTATDFLGEETFLASVREKQGKVRIDRSVISTAPAGSFIFNNALDTATVAPPAPFTGSAGFQRAAGSASWSGDLAAAFLGRGGEVGLAGPAFKATLAH